METKRCKECGEVLPINRFNHTRKNGKVYFYRMCKLCRLDGLTLTSAQKKDSERNRAFNALMRFPPPKL